MEQGEFVELVRASRTYRRFDESRRVTMGQLRALVEAARLAPTGNNTQTLRFHLSVEPDEVLEVFSHHRWAGLLAEWDGPEAGERPTAYVTIAAPAGARSSAIRNQDAGIAAQTIMLAARAAGLVGCMVGSFDGSLGAALGLVDRGLEPLLVCALGYPAPDERVVLEPGDTPHGVAYWRDFEAHTQHVPKLSADDLLV